MQSGRMALRGYSCLSVPVGKKEVKSKREQAVAVAVLEVVGPAPAGTVAMQSIQHCHWTTWFASCCPRLVIHSMLI
jgi:hypothetical protein